MPVSVEGGPEVERELLIWKDLKIRLYIRQNARSDMATLSKLCTRSYAKNMNYLIPQKCTNTQQKQSLTMKKSRSRGIS